MSLKKELTLGDKIKNFDFYKDLPRDLAEPTVQGATASMFVLTIMAALFISQFYQFMQYQKQSEILIDVNEGQEKIDINLNITLQRCPCDILSLDIVDVTGVHVVDVQGTLQKHRLNEQGDMIASSNALDKTNQNIDKNKVFDDTVQALDNKEGCQVEGTVIINKVPGNFHVSTHAFGDVVQKLYMSGKRLDFSHKINHLSFGSDREMKEIYSKYGDLFKFDLDGINIDQNLYLYQGQLLANYYLDVNAVEYLDATQSNNVKIYNGYKHRTSRSLLAQLGLPAIFFRYELSPVKLRYTLTYKSFTDFFIQVCAIVGGMFAMAGILEAVLRNSYHLIVTKEKQKR